MTRDQVKRMWDLIDRLREKSRHHFPGNMGHNEAEWDDLVILIERYGKEGVGK